MSDRGGSTVIDDAKVLYPARLGDFLIRIAMAGLVRARWTDAIYEEWIQNLLRNRPDLRTEQLRRTRELMDRAVPDCLVVGYDGLIEGLKLPDPDDRHVLAAAIQAKATLILTLNVRDFPTRALAPHGITSGHPDDFLAALFDNDPDAVCEAARLQRTALTSPAQSPEELLETLSRSGSRRRASARFSCSMSPAALGTLALLSGEVLPHLRLSVPPFPAREIQRIRNLATAAVEIRRMEATSAGVRSGSMNQSELGSPILGFGLHLGEENRWDIADLAELLASPR